MKKEMFTWTEEDSVGVRLFDEQHKMFFHIANNIFDLLCADIEKSMKQNLLISLARYLEGYAILHLNSEEKCFNEFHYEDAAHIKAHDAFREAMGKFMCDVEQESFNMEEKGKEMAEFSGNWLLNHIRVVDKQYSNFFHEHGMH